MSDYLHLYNTYFITQKNKSQGVIIMKLSEFKIFTKNLALFMKLGKNNIESEIILLNMKVSDLKKILQNNN